MTALTFRDAVQLFRASEAAESVLVLCGKTPLDDNLRRVFLAWPNVPIKAVAKAKQQFQDGPALWGDLWETVEPDLEALRRFAGMTSVPTRYFDILRGNRLIYPDGTVSEIGQRALRAMAKRELKL
jgi:hypothetical protein